MVDKEMAASVTVEWIDTTEEPFEPKGTTNIFAVLEPIEKEEATWFPPDYVDFYKTLAPPFIPKFGDIPEFEAEPGELIINIETTRVKPFEGKIACIGVLDPNVLEPQAMNFIRETELETLDEFLEWFKTTNYTTLIGYNVSFDYRWLYVLMQRHRRNVPRWPEMKLCDLMQQQKQVKDEFVFGRNPDGKLEEWATYLFGAQPYAPQKQVFTWIKEGNVDEIVNFNTDKLTKAYFLWVLDKIVSGTIPGAEVLGRPALPTTGNPVPGNPGHANPEVKKLTVSCPNCMQTQDMLQTDKVINCHVCGTPISNPVI